MWWLIGYVVSVVLAYVLLRALEIRESGKWNLRKRVQAVGFGLFGPLMLLFCFGHWIGKCVDWDKEVKW